MRKKREKKSGGSNLLFIMKLTRKSMWFFAAGIVFAAFSSYIDMIVPDIIRITIDSVIGDAEMTVPAYASWLAEGFSTEAVSGYLKSNLWVLAAAVAVLSLLSAFFTYAYSVMNGRGSESLAKKLRDSLYSHLEKLSFTWYNSNHTGDIIQRCTSDVETVRQFVSDQLVSAVRIVILMVISMIFMFRIDTTLSLAVAATFPIIFLYTVIFGKKTFERFYEADACSGELSTICQENLTGIRVVKAFGRERYERKSFDSKNDELIGKWMKLHRVSTVFWGVGDFISGLQVMLVLVLGTVFAVKGRLTVGQLIAYISYNALLSWPVRELGRVVSNISRAGVSIDRVCYILRSEPETEPENPVRPDMSGDIVFDHVSFSYDGGTEALKDVSFTIPGGSVVGVMGSTGSGKSTLVELLDRIYDLEPGNGRITISGTDLSRIPRDWVRSHIGLVLQEPFLFAGTLKDNIGITRDHPEMSEITRASKAADMDRTANSFTDGYKTVIGERGVTLSGGQMQRVAIARMLMEDTPIKVLDDSLSAVDSLTDSRIRSALDSEFSDSTVIIVSHRVRSLENADMVIVLDNGRVVQTGTPEELSKAEGLYKETLEIQAGTD
ncbi:MAG: ABC transporter ATP-binding protein [Oscillospiraceae bacterium]|jgi:ATP-binding cassette subfamily B protein